MGLFRMINQSISTDLYDQIRFIIGWSYTDAGKVNSIYNKRKLSSSILHGNTHYQQQGHEHITYKRYHIKRRTHSEVLTTSTRNSVQYLRVR